MSFLDVKAAEPTMEDAQWAYQASGIPDEKVDKFKAPSKGALSLLKLARGDLAKFHQLYPAKMLESVRVAKARFKDDHRGHDEMCAELIAACAESESEFDTGWEPKSHAVQG